jgi:hypothetical protein
MDKRNSMALLAYPCRCGHPYFEHENDETIWRPAFNCFADLDCECDIFTPTTRDETTRAEAGRLRARAATFPNDWSVRSALSEAADAMERDPVPTPKEPAP